MNRRSFFRLSAGVVGAVAVAPKLLTEALPVAAEPVVGVLGWAETTPAMIEADFAAIYQPRNFYLELNDLCKEFFGSNWYFITERLDNFTVDIQALRWDNQAASSEQRELFERGLFNIRPAGVMVNLNGESAIAHTNDFLAELYPDILN